MRTKNIYLILLFFGLIIIVSFTQCKNENEELLHNIVLYNQPLSTIQKYIQGKWKFVYGKGGISSNTMYYCDTCFIEFTLDNKIISNSFATTKASTILWMKDIGTYTNNESTYLMTFKDYQGVPWVYVIDRICNDTLIIHDNSSDAIFYHFIKSN
ncbi:MAG: hypothetical protein PHG64_02075 [Paludibacter sp.]|nr:hypothetical protein [Paludibacter sp.]